MDGGVGEGVRGGGGGGGRWGVGDGWVEGLGGRCGMGEGV